ncbi:hypothetical protein EDB92DRAFT_2106740 [Lactarius akahatsu]|uniref:Uncharacterized protein n=1 Tax=Lactarius akahatsu TaxID=416441 RepID=A0AAD4LCV9_9AGAM|nr:hypothetical protein EDB92DRAFT_2106740 [Lactarius akahatsu]
MESMSDDPGRPSWGGGGRTGEGGKTEVTPTGTSPMTRERKRGTCEGLGLGGKKRRDVDVPRPKVPSRGGGGQTRRGEKDRGRSHRYLRHVLRTWAGKKKTDRERERRDVDVPRSLVQGSIGSGTRKGDEGDETATRKGQRPTRTLERTNAHTLNKAQRERVREASAGHARPSHGRLRSRRGASEVEGDLGSTRQGRREKVRIQT